MLELRPAAVLLGALLFSGCSVLTAASRSAQQCAADTDCEALGSGLSCSDEGWCFDASGPWTCVSVPVAPPSPLETLSYSLLVVEAASRDPLEGVLVRACDSRDLACANPVAGPVLTTADGRANFEVPGDFTGYAEVLRDDLVPSLTILNVDDPETTNIGIGLFEPDFFATLGLVLGVSVTEQTSAFNVAMINCNGELSAGASFDVQGDDVGSKYYLIDNFPTLDATETDIGGVGGTVGIAPGVYDFVARVGETGEVITQSSVLVRAGWVSQINASARLQGIAQGREL